MEPKQILNNQNNLEKEKTELGGISLPNFKLYYKAIEQVVSDLPWSDLGFFNITTVQTRYPFSRNRTLNFELFLGQQYTVRYSHDAGQQQQAAAPSQPRDQGCKQPIHLQQFCTHTTILCFTFSVVFKGLCEIPHYYKIGFVFDDFVKLQVNLSVLSTFKVGQTKLCFSVGQVYYIHFQLNGIFN